MSNTYFKIIYVLFYFILLLLFLGGGSLVKFHTMATKSKKKVPSNRVQRIFFGKERGKVTTYQRKKKSLKDPYCDNGFLKNNKN